MLHAHGLSNISNIWLYICSFIFHDHDQFSEEILLPGILWGVPDIEGRETIHLEIFSITRRSGTVVIEILRILVGGEVYHNSLTLAEVGEKCNK